MTDGQVAAARQAWADAAAGEPGPALVELTARLGLSPFEQQILLLCAAMELDPATPGLCALAQRDERRPWPTFALALELFPDPSWEALSPRGPLRDWRLVEITQPPGQPLTASALRADERIVSYIKGLNYLDDRIEPLLAAVPRPEDGLPASQRVTATAVLEGWARSAELSPAPVVQLLGSDPAAKLSVAADAAGRLGRQLYRLPACCRRSPPTWRPSPGCGRGRACCSRLCCTSTRRPRTVPPPIVRSGGSWPTAVACSCSGPGRPGRS